MIDPVLGPTSRLQPEQCPVCRATLDAATIIDSSEGKIDLSEGDFTVCIYCATALRFGIGMRLEVPQSEGLREFQREQPDKFSLFMKLQVAARQRLMAARRRNFRRN